MKTKRLRQKAGGKHRGLGARSILSEQKDGWINHSYRNDHHECVKGKDEICRKQPSISFTFSQRSGHYLQLRREHPSRREKQLGDGGKTSSLESTVQAQKSGNGA